MKKDPGKKLESLEGEVSDKSSDLYKPLALLAIFIIIVSISYSKKWRTNSTESISENSSDSKKSKRSNIERINPLGSEQTVELKEKSDQYVVSDNGRNVIAFSENSVICYEVGTTKSIRLKDTTPDLFRSGDFLPDGSFVMGSETGVGIWDMTTGSRKFSMKAPGGVETVTVSPDGQLVAGVSRDDGRIWLWETQKGTSFKESSGNKQSFRSSLYFEDPSRLKVFEVVNNRSRVLTLEIPSMKFIAGNWFDATELNLKFAVNGLWLESGSTNRNITEPELVVYEGQTGTEAGSIKLGTDGSGAMVDERHSLTVDREGIVNLIDLSAGEKMQILDLDGKAHLVTTSKNGSAAVIQIEPRKIVVFPVPIK